MKRFPVEPPNKGAPGEIKIRLIPSRGTERQRTTNVSCMPVATSTPITRQFITFFLWFCCCVCVCVCVCVCFFFFCSLAQLRIAFIAIQTVVTAFDEEVVRKSIENELARDGQVYFIHNRVESIDSLATLVVKLIPQARVVVGHGQMGEKELEKVMLKFIRGEANVLVATTIVENGLDIPHANTILINRADRLGLAELYQLRGRVGRSHQRAYAYLLVPPETILTEIARKRLAAMKEFSELGAGFRIAALDLELRGAGNMLGRQQHGHIEAIGFDLYVQMLERAVAKLKGTESAPEQRTTINLGMDVRIPQEYIPSENLRLRTYKRVSSVATEEEKQDVRKELEDRFGPLPKSVENLLEFAMLKSMSERLHIASIERQGTKLAVRFHPETQLDPAVLVKVVRSRKGISSTPVVSFGWSCRRVNRSPQR